MQAKTAVQSLGALALFVAGVGLVGVGPVAAVTKKPQVVVSPWNGLRDNEMVKVSGKNFTPKETVYIVECLASATGGSQCNTLGAMGVKISASGQLPPTKFKVVTGVIGSGTGTCGTKASDLKSCAISVGTATGGDSATAKIVFRAPPDKSKKGSGY